MLFSRTWRSWRSAKGVLLLAVVALAAGIGSATAIYTVIRAVMLKPLPYRDGERFVMVFSSTTNDPEHYGSVSSQDARQYQARTQSFDAFGWFRFSGKNLTYAGEPYHVNGAMVTLPLVRGLGVDPALGEWFTDDTGAVISNSLWRKLGSDPGIVGKPLRLDGRSYTVTGVMPAIFYLPAAGTISTGDQTDVWMALDPNESAGAYFIYARRKADVRFAAAEADVKRVAAQFAAEDPVYHPAYSARVFDLREIAIKDIRPTLLILFGAAGLLFLITCANAAGLLLARSVERARETAIRVALGARRRQLAAQYFAESFLVSLAGAMGGILLSTTLTRAIASMASDYLPRSEEIGLDWTVLLFALVAALLATLLSSLAPLWQAARIAPAEVLSEGVRASAGLRTRRRSQLLVVGEIALAFGLLAVSAVLITHLKNLSRTSAGFNTDHVLSFVLSVPGPAVDELAKRASLQRRLIDAIKTVPGAQEVALANQLPLKGCCMGTPIYAEGHPSDFNASLRTSLMAVSPDYFRAMQIPLRSGRLFTDQDAVKDLLWVVVDQTAAKRFWGDQNPVGAYGRLESPTGGRFQVIGVVGDVKNDGLNNPTVPEIYIPSFILRVESMNFVVRSSQSPASLMPDIRRVVRDFDPEQPITEVATMSKIMEETMTLEQLASLITSFFAAAALLLAMLGVFGVVSYSVRQRTVEIGTRMALGATNQEVLSLVIGRGLKMAGFGIAAGGVAAIAAGFYLRGIFKMDQLERAPFLYSTAIVAGTAFAASFLPAWRAAFLSPMVAIRNEPESLLTAAVLRAKQAINRLSSSGEPSIVPLGTLINEFAGSLRSTASFQEAFETVLLSLRERIHAQSIMLLEKTSPKEYRAEDVSLPTDGLLANRLRHFPHPLTLSRDDFDTWMRWAQEFKPEHIAEIETLRKTDARIAVPLRSKNESVGILLLGPPAGREEYTASEKQVLSSSAEVFALIIENARLAERALEEEKLRRDLALAAEVQRRLLPPEPPASATATFAATSLPARTVGGDYYDFLSLPGERIGITVADISGKGIAAALLMSVVQASLRVISTQDGLPLSELAVRMNGFLYRSTGSNKYATFFYAQLEERGRCLRYVNAGHNPPYLVRPNGAGVEITELKEGGTVLGLFPHVEYTEATIDLASGDLVVAFTDGVTEALNPQGEEFGDERLKELLRNTGHRRAEDVSRRLSDTLRDWIGSAEQHDDLTFVVVAVN